MRQSCADARSAPVGWLGTGPATPADRKALIAAVLADPDLLADIVARAAADRMPTGGNRHDGWTGERIAHFLEVLADTGIVAEACRVVGMSRDAAYALRRRDPVVAAAWRAAQAKARPLVADGLLERSITGTVEHYYRDGVLVGERRHYESWLGLAMLKRLDRQAEEDRAGAALAARIADRWQGALDALRAGGSAAVAPALAKADEADIPPPPGSDPDAYVWKTDSGAWMTAFPPPPGFDGEESRPWDGLSCYERTCTAEEAELLDANAAAAEAEDNAYAQAQRDDYFTALRTARGAAGELR